MQQKAGEETARDTPPPPNLPSKNQAQPPCQEHSLLCCCFGFRENHCLALQKHKQASTKTASQCEKEKRREEKRKRKRKKEQQRQRRQSDKARHVTCLRTSVMLMRDRSRFMYDRSCLSRWRCPSCWQHLCSSLHAGSKMSELSLYPRVRSNMSSPSCLFFSTRCAVVRCCSSDSMMLRQCTTMAISGFERLQLRMSV